MAPLNGIGVPFGLVDIEGWNSKVPRSVLPPSQNEAYLGLILGWAWYRKGYLKNLRALGPLQIQHSSRL